jgi:hypothetical protein
MAAQILDALNPKVGFTRQQAALSGPQALFVVKAAEATAAGITVATSIAEFQLVISSKVGADA